MILSTPETVIVKNGLVLWLSGKIDSSYPETGSTWYDISSNQNNATWIAGTPSFDSQYGGSIEFDGSSKLDAASSQLNNLVNDFTVSCWYKDTSSPVEPQLHYSRNGSSGFMLGMRRSDSSTKWKLTKYGIIDIYLGTVPTDNEWHNVCVTYSSTGGVSVYVDGQYQDNNTNTQDIIVSNIYNIGAAQVGNHTGNIGDYFVYDTVLTAEEILNNFEAIRGRYAI